MKNPTSLQVEESFKGKELTENFKSFCREFVVHPDDVETYVHYGITCFKIKGNNKIWTNFNRKNFESLS